MIGSKRFRIFLLASVLVCELAATAGALGADWPMWRHDANRSAASPAALPAQLHLQWSRELAPPRPAFPNDPRQCFDGSVEPVVMGKMIFVPSMVSDSVTALDTESGAVRWTFFADGPVRFAPVASDGKVYCVSDDGHLVCLDAASGQVRWKFRGLPAGRSDRTALGNERLVSLWPARGGPVLADGTVYFAAGIWPFEGVYVYAIHAATGKPVWVNQDSGTIEGGLIDHGARRDAGLSPQGYLAVVGAKLIVPSGRALPGFFDRKTGRMDPYTTGWGGRVALAKGSWWVCGIGQYLFQSGDLYGLTPRAASLPAAPKPKELWSQEEFAAEVHVPLPTVQQWVKKGMLTTVEREGKRFVRLHKPDAATYLSWWTKPFRGGEEPVVQAHPRLQLDSANAKELGEFRQPVLTPQAVYYSRPVNTQPKGSYRPVGQGYAGIVAYDITKPKWGVVCCQGHGRGPSIFTSRGIAFTELWRLPSTLEVHIKAGPRLYAGGPGVVAAVDVPQPGGLPKVSWQAKLPGTPRRMLAADGKLFVVTAAGRLCCFGARKVEPKTYAARKPQAPSTADEWAERAGRILEETGATEGYALALGVGTGRLAAALARRSKLRIIAIEPDAAKVAGLRQTLHAQGLYGARIAVRRGSPLSYPLPPYLASLIVSEDLAAAGLEAGKPFVEKLFRCLRPYGGVACLAVPSGRRRAFSRWVKEARLPGAEVTRAGGFVLLRRRGALAGSAGWMHERADAGNTFTSRDERVKPPFGVLWFGGSVDRIFPDWDYTHAAYPSPLVVAGRMLIQVGNDLHAADVYTGRHLWTAVLPPLKTKRTGHNYAAVEDGVYVACDETCLRLDPATGARLGQLATPAGLGGSKPEVWRDIRLWRDALIGSTGSCLVCLDRRTGRERWTVQSQREIVSLAIGGDKVFCADCSLPDRRGKVRKTQGRILALDARTTDVLWQTPLKVKTNKRIPPQLIYCEPTDVLLTVCETVTARQGRSGAVLWQKPIAGCNPAMLGRQRLITQLGEMFDPLTGSRLPGRLWSGAPNRVTRGCNHAIAAEHLVTIRDGHASCFDPVTCRQTFFRGVRSGCTNSLIPADGLLNAPNFARGCSCNYAVFTSLALVPRPAAGR